MRKIKNKRARKITTKRKSARRNPMTFNKDNLRRWAYVNIPKYEYSERYGFDPELETDLINYFNVPSYSMLSATMWLRPYLELRKWLIREKKFSKEKKEEIWKDYLVKDPSLFEAMYLD